MKNILDNIVAVKQQEVKELKLSFNMDQFRSVADRKCISLTEKLNAPGSTGLIAEFKRKSPSKGWFTSPEQDPLPIVNAYEQYGAAGASILTDEQFFGGNIHDLSIVRNASDLPLLRKDFIIDEIQVQQAKAHGADVILLIAAILSPKRVYELATEAKAYGLEVLLEIHNETEAGHICDLVHLVGINNRNLKTFETNIETSFRLMDKIPPHITAISESGISDVQTIQQLRSAGFKGFLIGESFMKANDPSEAFSQFMNELKSRI